MTALPAMVVGPRVDRVRRAIADTGIDSLVLTRLVNIRYLTGFTGSAAEMVVTSGDLLLVTDSRYAEQAREQLDLVGSEARLVIGSREVQLAAISEVAGRGRIGTEDRTPWSRVLELEDELHGALEPVSGIVEAGRELKDAAELARIVEAARIADEALAVLLSHIGSGDSEKQLVRRLERTMEDLGADGVSFPTILASGPNAARPHARPGDRVPTEGDLVIVDFGAEVDGYRSDMTRTFVVGEPSVREGELIDVVTRAQAAGVEAAGPGVPTSEVDRACRDLIGEAGLADHFTHGTGHGVGLVIHEDPFLGRKTEGVLAPGHVVTVEPGVYLTGVGGVRVEDTLVVTADGAETLTHHPKDVSL